jgi:hypothetical protein
MNCVCHFDVSFNLNRVSHFDEHRQQIQFLFSDVKQSCDLAYDIFECISNKISEVSRSIIKWKRI